MVSRFAGDMPILSQSQGATPIADMPRDSIPLTILTRSLVVEVYHLLEYTGNKAKVAAAIAKVVRKVPPLGMLP